MSENDENIMSDKQLYRESASYLIEASQIPSLPIALKSIYSTRAFVLQNRANQAAPKGQKTEFFRCGRCCLLFSESKATFKLKPAVELRKRFMRKIIKKIEQKKVLTRLQAKYIKRFHKKYHKLGRQFFIATCKFCNSDTKIPIVKVKKSTPKKVVATPVQTKKKKKSVDKFCGLNKKAVESAKKVNASTPKKNSTPSKNLKFIRPAFQENSQNNKKMIVEKFQRNIGTLLNDIEQKRSKLQGFLDSAK